MNAGGWRAQLPPHNYFYNFYVKIVCFGAFWVIMLCNLGPLGPSYLCSSIIATRLLGLLSNVTVPVSVWHCSPKVRGVLVNAQLQMLGPPTDWTSDLKRVSSGVASSWRGVDTSVAGGDMYNVHHCSVCDYSVWLTVIPRCLCMVYIAMRVWIRRLPCLLCLPLSTGVCLLDGLHYGHCLTKLSSLPWELCNDKRYK